MSEERHRVNEDVLERASISFAQIGQALKEIQADRSYEADGFETFGQYLRKWNLTLEMAEALIECDETYDSLVNAGLPADDE